MGGRSGGAQGHLAVLDNRVEPLFWARLITGLTRAGVQIFLVASTMCVVAIFWDYWM